MKYVRYAVYFLVIVYKRARLQYCAAYLHFCGSRDFFFFVFKVVPHGRGLGAAKQVEGQRKGKREKGRGDFLIYIENDVMPVRVGTEPNGLWD